MNEKGVLRLKKRLEIGKNGFMEIVADHLD